MASTQSRANPELTLATTRDRGASGERYGQTVTLAVRIPFGAGPRHDARVASARADAAEAQAQLALDRARLQSERESAVARVQAARSQLAAAERRATLARETRGVGTYLDEQPVTTIGGTLDVQAGAHGGTVEVESTLGRGTCVRLHFRPLRGG